MITRTRINPTHSFVGAAGSGGDWGQRGERELGRGLLSFEMAEALGYVPPLSAELRADFDRVIGTLMRLDEHTG
jgi:hypothetical protein